MYGTHHLSDVILTLHQLFRFFSDFRLLLFIFCFSLGYSKKLVQQ